VRYVLVTNLPFGLTPNGAYAVDELWGWDLKAHLEALNKHLPHYKLYVYAPMESYDPKKHRYIFARDAIVFCPLPNFKSKLEFIKNFPKIICIFLREFRKSDVLHSTATFYPPIGLTANLVGLFRRCSKRLLVIDADTIGDFELLAAMNKSIRKLFYLVIKRLVALVLKIQIRLTPLVFVVGDVLYERFKNYRNVVKIYASWVRREDIISSASLLRKIESSKRSEKIKLCFAARLILKKNPVCAIQVAKILKSKGIPFKLDIFGEGQMKEELKELVKKYELEDHVTFKGLIPYGETFYNALREYDAILVPNLSGEQPRIIFDAMANGLVVIGSTNPFKGIIKSGINGILCDPRNPESFALAVQRLYEDRGFQERLIYAGIKAVEENNINSIHERRMKILINRLKLNSA